MMRRVQIVSGMPGRLRQLIFVLTGLCLLVLLLTPVAAEEFSAPTILRPPFPEDVEDFAFFGEALAIDRSTLAVSAPGVRGGTVYVYERLRDQPGQWRLTDVLENLSPCGSQALALEGDTMVVGSEDRERAYVFRRSRRGWGLLRVLGPRLLGSRFGVAVAISGQRIAVGAPRKHRVQIYQRNATGTNRWGRTATLEGTVASPALAACLDAARPVPGFGESVALSGRRLAVGAYDRKNPAFFGKIPRNNGTYVFEPDPESATGWRQLTDVAPPAACDDDAAPNVHLDGPDLLIDKGVVAGRWAIHGRNLGGADGWGRRTGRRAPPAIQMTTSALRGNLVAIGDRNDDAAWIYARDYPALNRWGLVARLSTDAVPQLPCCLGGRTTTVAIGPREVVTGHPKEEVVQIFPRAPILGDDFESGDTSAWSGRRGRVEVVGPGLGASNAALAVTIGGDPRASLVASNYPQREPSVSLSFTLQPNRIDLAGRPLDIVRLFAGKPFLRLKLTQDAFGATYRIGLQARLRGGAWFTVGGLKIPEDEERRISFEYDAPSATGAADGRVRLDVDGRNVRQVRNLDMERLLVGRVALGLPAGSSAAAGGTFLIDDFEMHR